MTQTDDTADTHRPDHPYLAVAVDAESGAIIASRVSDHQLDEHELETLLTEAIAESGRAGECQILFSQTPMDIYVRDE